MAALSFVVIALVVAAAALRPRVGRRELAAGTTPRRLDGIVAALALRRDLRRAPSARAVASWCDDIARRVRSGSSLSDAIATAPTDPATALATSALVLAIDRGQSVADAAARVPDAGPHLRLALGVIATTGRLGGPAAASIDRTAVLLRQRAADIDERTAHAAQARLSTHVMTAVPILMLATLLVTDDDVRSVVTSPLGAAFVGGGLVANVAGWWWMRDIIGAMS